MPKKRLLPPTLDVSADQPGDYDVLTPADAAEMLGVSRTTLWRMKLPKVRRGTGWARIGYLRKTIRLAQLRLHAA